MIANRDRVNSAANIISYAENNNYIDAGSDIEMTIDIITNLLHYINNKKNIICSAHDILRIAFDHFKTEIGE